MNYENQIGFLQRDIKDLQKAINELQDNYDNALFKTSLFLDECKKGGITKVTIGKKHHSVPASISFSFGAHGSVFQYVPKKNKDKKEGYSNGWPPIWTACGKAGISTGCGNPDQHQVNDISVIDGVYHLKNGEWHKVD